MRRPGAAWALAALAAACAGAEAGAEAACALACAVTASCREDYCGIRESQYEIHGQQVSIYFDGKFLKITCDDRNTLDWASLPRSSQKLHVKFIEIKYCTLPTEGSIASALAALNVSLLCDTSSKMGDCQLKLRELRGSEPLPHALLAGLPPLTALVLAAAPNTTISATADLLAELPALRCLDISYVRLPPDALDLLQSDLIKLWIKSTGLERLSQKVLRNLTSLSVDEKNVTTNLANDILRAPRLNALSLTTPTITLELETLLPAALETLVVTGWAPQRAPQPLQRCPRLRSLRLEQVRVEAPLPARWLAACATLQVLVLQGASPAPRMPEDLLAGADALTDMILSWNQIETLHHRLLYHTPLLRSLDLRNNLLETIPSGIFAQSGELRELWLAGNKLTMPSMFELQYATGLRVLDLSHNARLSDLCITGGESPLKELAQLTQLTLSSTRVSTICADWRLRMPLLATLALEHSGIVSLENRDLEFNRSVTSTVQLRGANVSRVVFHEGEAPAGGGGGALVSVQLDPVMRLRCDCAMYWTWAALVGGRWPARMSVAPLTCRDGRALATLREDDLLCPGRGVLSPVQECEHVPAECGCEWQPALLGGMHLRVTCEHAGLRHMPPALANITHSVDLLLAHNDLVELRLEHLPPFFREVDVRQNRLGSIDPRIVAALNHSLGRRLSVADNPLQCGCGAAYLLSELHLRATAVADYASARCAGGELLRLARPASCAALSLAGAAAMLLLAAAVAWLSRRDSRLLLKAVLLHAGLWPRRPAPDDSYEYDAFVTFSHEDCEYAVELVKRLEGLSPPHRLCVHYRDWVPGRWIPEQITDSVRRSRRTIALVSPHFLRSTWARAEFREAHAAALRDATPRLVVVLMVAPATLPLDTELHHYMRLNTYVRWGDPWFWQKLRLALPPPRSPPAPRDDGKRLHCNILSTINTAKIAISKALVWMKTSTILFSANAKPRVITNPPVNREPLVTLTPSMLPYIYSLDSPVAPKPPVTLTLDNTHK